LWRHQDVRRVECGPYACHAGQLFGLADGHLPRPALLLVQGLHWLPLRRALRLVLDHPAVPRGHWRRAWADRAHLRRQRQHRLVQVRSCVLWSEWGATLRLPVAYVVVLLPSRFSLRPRIQTCRRVPGCRGLELPSRGLLPVAAEDRTPGHRTALAMFRPQLAVSAMPQCVSLPVAPSRFLPTPFPLAAHSLQRTLLISTIPNTSLPRSSPP
jgi:hypothetical protein